MELIDEISPRERHREKELTNKKRPISYTAIVLSDRSKDRLKKALGDLIPDGWEEIIHHMTVNMGEANPEHIKFLNFPINLFATHIGLTDKAIAVAVEGFDSNNKTPHITLAVNRKDGGKPVHSNEIKEWKPLRKKIMINGDLTEVPYKI